MPLQEPTLRRLRICARVGYYVCWIATCAVVAWLAVLFLWKSVYGQSALRGIDYDLAAALLVPVAALAGAWAAWRTTGARRFQLGCLAVGFVLFVVGLFLALAQFRQAEAVSGTGAFAGLGEAIIGLLCAIGAGIGLLIVGIGVAGGLNHALERRLQLGAGRGPESVTLH